MRAGGGGAWDTVIVHCLVLYTCEIVSCPPCTTFCILLLDLWCQLRDPRNTITTASHHHAVPQWLAASRRYVNGHHPPRRPCARQQERTHPLTPSPLYTGFTGDIIGKLLNRTAFNPVLTLAVILLAKYTDKGRALAAEHKTALTWAQRLLAYGLVRWVGKWADEGVINNWTKDEYDWKKEIVVITGGAGGIGGQVVKLFEERGITVVVLDVIPMTFTTGKSSDQITWTSSREARKGGTDDRKHTQPPTSTTTSATSPRPRRSPTSRRGSGPRSASPPC